MRNPNRFLWLIIVTSFSLILSCSSQEDTSQEADSNRPGKRQDLYFEISAMGAVSYFYDHKMGLERAGDYFGVETHLATGGKDTVNDVEAKLNLLWGVFLRGAYPINNFRLYGLLGAANLNMSIDATIDGEEVNGTDRVTRISYGAGVEYLFNKKWGFNIDYIVYLASDNFDFSGTSVGFVYRF